MTEVGNWQAPPGPLKLLGPRPFLDSEQPYARYLPKRLESADRERTAPIILMARVPLPDNADSQPFVPTEFLPPARDLARVRKQVGNCGGNRRERRAENFRQVHQRNMVSQRR